MDKTEKKIVAALRQGVTDQLSRIDEDREHEALINVKTTDLRAVLDLIDRAASFAPKPPTPVEAE